MLKQFVFGEAFDQVLRFRHWDLSEQVRRSRRGQPSLTRAPPSGFSLCPSDLSCRPSSSLNVVVSKVHSRPNLQYSSDRSSSCITMFGTLVIRLLAFGHAFEDRHVAAHCPGSGVDW